MGALWCNNRESTHETLYGDYIFNHERLLKITVSELLSDNINIGDYIYLKVCLDDVQVFHSCLVHTKKRGQLFVSLVNPHEDFSEIKYIKKL